MSTVQKQTKLALVGLCIVSFSLIHPSECVKYSSKYKSAELSKRTTENYGIDSTTPIDRDNERVEDYWPVKVFNCIGSSGVEKCLKIFLIRRMDHVLEVFDREKQPGNVSIEFDVIGELRKQFRWGEYKNISDSQLNKMLLKNIKSIFSGKMTKLVVSPGIDVDITPNDEGTIMLNIKKDPDLQLPRGMMNKKAFYRIVPMLLVPPLIISAFMPFVLPAMKMMVIWVSMLNQMALTGAVFTLMRDSAFQEPQKKIVYVNEGYKNEKRPGPNHGRYPPPPHFLGKFAPLAAMNQHALFQPDGHREEFDHFEEETPETLIPGRFGEPGGLFPLNHRDAPHFDDDFDKFSSESGERPQILHPQNPQHRHPGILSGPFPVEKFGKSRFPIRGRYRPLNKVPEEFYSDKLDDPQLPFTHNQQHIPESDETLSDDFSPKKPINPNKIIPHNHKNHHPQFDEKSSRKDRVNVNVRNKKPVNLAGI